MRVLFVALLMLLSSLAAHAGETFGVGDTEPVASVSCSACEAPCSDSGPHQADHAGTQCHECEPAGACSLAALGGATAPQDWPGTARRLHEDAVRAPGFKPPIA